ncbi:MAG: nitrous oxide-stimulated promoter family protein [Planctomycetota bacterium]|jgi:hypothetical protein
MSGSARRIQREKRTIKIMIEMYCRDHHAGEASGGGGAAPGSLCDHCATLHDYAMERIDKCPFCLAKPTCANCPIHCYKRDMREEVRAVMRYSGPRMLGRHPVLAILHKLDGRRRVELPVRKRRGT